MHVGYRLSTSPINRRLTCLALLAAVLGWPCPASGGEPGVIIWVHPDNTPKCLRIESAASGVVAALRAADGRSIQTVDGLRRAGWRVADDGLWETPPRSGGRKLTFAVSGLPAGTHRVFVRFFSQPRVPGNEWWYITRAGLGSAKGKGFTYKSGTVIQGTGGHDPTTLYEAEVGEAGSEQNPLSTISLWIERYQWSQTSRVGSIRIETVPSMRYAKTQERTAENDAVRAALLAHGPSAPGVERPYGIGVVSGALKLRPKTCVGLQGREIAGEIRVAAARGEYESRQVLVYPPVQSLRGVQLETSALTGPGGAVIPASEVLFAPVGYCPYTMPSDLSVHGYWPEPVLTFLKSFSVEQHDVQSLWFRVHVPRGVRPGEYRGSATIRPENAAHTTIPVHVTVWDLDRPAMPHLRVVVGCNRPGAFEMSYGLNPGSIYGFRDEWMEEMPKWAAAGARAINLAYIWGRQLDKRTKLPTEQQLDEWVAQIRQRYDAATKAGLRDACYVYLFDEAKSEWDPAMRLVSQRFRKEFPDLLLLTTAHRAWSADGPVKDGGATIDAINGWCPIIFHYRHAAAAEARRWGKQVWWYTCNSPQKPYPNVLMTHPLIDIRLLMGFMAFAYQTDGFLYYATAGGYYKNVPAITSGPYTAWGIPDNAHNHLYQ